MKKRVKKRNKRLEKEKNKKRVLIALCIVLGVAFILSLLTGGFRNQGKSYEKEENVNIEEKAKAAVDYINAIYSSRGLIFNLRNIIENDAFYILNGDVNNQSFQLYMTKDGNWVFFSAPLEVIKKSEKPEVKLFVMSFCPFGNQAENSMKPVYDLLKKDVNFEVHYIVSPEAFYKGMESSFCYKGYCSMHGIEEVYEDVRELCVFKYYNKTKGWDYIVGINKNCSLNNVSTCWKIVAEGLGIDTNKIEECVEKEGRDLLENEYKTSMNYGATASPTLFINNIVYNWDRTPEAYKSVICEAFNEKPEECNYKLNSNTTQLAGTC